MRNRLTKAIRAWRGKPKRDRLIPADTLGSYTGVPEDEHDLPDQDADDL